MKLRQVVRVLIFFICITQNEIIALKRSLAFVFDTTLSMDDDLKSFKQGAGIILDSYSKNSDIGISEFVLSPFNNPGFGPIQSTQNVEEFRSIINAINIYGGHCDEYCLSGLKLALENVLPNSYIFVMTDATERDTYLKDEVIKLAQTKQCQITFFFTIGNCDKNGRVTYMEIAKISSGQIFELNKADDIFESLKYINTTLDSKSFVYDIKENPKGFDNRFEVNVDETVNQISIVVAGGHPKMEVINPLNETVSDPKKIVKKLDLDRVQAINVIDPEAGTWTIKYGSDDKHTLKVSGLSELEFDYGFSRFKIKNMSELTKEPSKGYQNNLIVAINKGAESLKSLENVELIDLSGKLLKRVALKNIFESSQGKVYETDEFYPPEGSFRMKINGVDKNGNKVSRISQTAIEQRDPGAPIVISPNQIEAKLDETISISCRAESSIPVSIRWFKGEKAVTDYEEFLQSGEILLEIENVNELTAGTYTCVAWNSLDTSTSETKVTIPGVTPINDIPYKGQLEPIKLSIDALM